MVHYFVKKFDKQKIMTKRVFHIMLMKTLYKKIQESVASYNMTFNADDI